MLCSQCGGRGAVNLVPDPGGQTVSGQECPQCKGRGTTTYDGPTFQEAMAAHEAVRAIAHLLVDGCPMWAIDIHNYCATDRVLGKWTRQFVDDIHAIVYPFASDLLAAPT